MGKWIDVDKEMPPVNVKVELSHGLVGIRGAVCDDWVTTGWMTKYGIWSLKKVNFKGHFKPTHWRHLPEIIKKK